MLETFAISFRLRNAYKKNSILFSLKSIPLIKKLLPASLYASKALNIFANIISAIGQFLFIFLGKAIYLAVIYYAAEKLHGNANDSYAHILIFLTIIGGIVNTQIFDPSKDKFYAMFLMRMDAKRFTISEYIFFLFKTFLGFLPFSLFFGLIFDTPFLVRLSVPIYVVAIKLCFTALSLRSYKKASTVLNENKLTPLIWIGIASLLAAAFVPPFFGYAIHGTLFCILTGVLLVPSVLAWFYILHFDEYRAIYKELLKPESFAAGTTKKMISEAEQLAMQKNIAIDPTHVSNKSGYKYFNELFMKRHAKILTRSAKRITILTLILFTAVGIACLLFPDFSVKVNELTMTFLPYFLFVMYMINRGKTITQALFMNCDHSMLTYRFYRQPKTVVSLFIERLKCIVVINLMPACVIALGLPLLLYITGGTDQPINYFLLFLSIISMSVFFSVHNIVLYYLLQPYNINLETRSVAYGFINFVTYWICYVAIGKEVPTLLFGTAVSVFCIVYIVVAILLAYRLAPQTFKLRQ